MLPGTALQLTVEVRNPSSAGAAVQQVKARRVLDRDKEPPFDFDLIDSTYREIAPGTTQEMWTFGGKVPTPIITLGAGSHSTSCASSSVRGKVPSIMKPAATSRPEPSSHSMAGA